jgi:hypothetical protein
VLAGVCLAVRLAAPARADFVETFDNGSDNGDWHLTTNPIRLLTIEPTGGNPGAYLHGQVESAVPTWYVPVGTQTVFLGDYYAQGVTGMGIDLNIINGNSEPDRTLTLDLQTTLGTGDPSLGLEAYFIGPDISDTPPGWFRYAFDVEARADTIPAGWTLLRGDGAPGTDADWRALMQHVETLGYELGQPGFAYTNHTVWDLGLDNVRLSTSPSAVPEPGGAPAGGLLLLATAGSAWRARRRAPRGSGRWMR